MTQPQYGQHAEYGPNDVCYMHRNHPSFTLCGRCGKTICPECQIEQPVGVICPDCVRELSPQKRVPKFGRKPLSAGSISRETPLVTYTIMTLCALVWFAQLLFPAVTEALWYVPLYSTPYEFQPWRMVTAIFTHSTSMFFHILFNMYALYAFGRELEAMLGKFHYLVLYMLSGVGGSLVVMWWSAVQHNTVLVPTVGASGALFGVIAAIFVAYRRLHVNTNSLLVLLVINLVIGFIPGFSISWQAHLGGMVFGALIMLLFLGTKRRGFWWLRWLGVIALIALIVGLSKLFYIYSEFPIWIY